MKNSAWLVLVLMSLCALPAVCETVLFGKIVDFPQEMEADIKKLLERTVWTENNGAVPLAEFIDSEKKGTVFSRVSFDAAADDGKWVDNALFGNSQFAVKAPEELKDAEVVLEEIKGIEEPETVRIAVLEEDKAVRSVKGNDENLSFFEYDDEVLLAGKNEDNRVIVSAEKNSIVRKYFNSLMRIVRKEVWDLKSGDKSAPGIIQTFSYGKGTKPETSVITSRDGKAEITYDEKGHVVKSEEYSRYKPDENSRERFVKQSVTEWVYNDKGNVLEKTTVDYSYNKTNTKLLKKNTRKEKYEFKVSEETSDYYYYENDVLCLSTVYHDEESCVTTMYFEGGFVIESYYEKGKRKKDIYYLNGDVRRVKEYVDL